MLQLAKAPAAEVIITEDVKAALGGEPAESAEGKSNQAGRCAPGVEWKRRSTHGLTRTKSGDERGEAE